MGGLQKWPAQRARLRKRMEDNMWGILAVSILLFESRRCKGQIAKGLITFWESLKTTVCVWVTHCQHCNKAASVSIMDPVDLRWQERVLSCSSCYLVPVKIQRIANSTELKELCWNPEQSIKSTNLQFIWGFWLLLSDQWQDILYSTVRHRPSLV